MVNPSQTGSFWLCPQCGKHVPTRLTACKCGFDRAGTGWKIEDHSFGKTQPLPPSDKANSWSVGRGTTVVGLALLLAGAALWAARPWLFSREAGGSQAGASRVPVRPRSAAPPASSGTVGHTSTQGAAPLLALPLDTELSGFSPDDRQKATELARRLSGGESSDATVIEADTLFRRYPTDPFAAQLLRAALLGAADRQLSARSFTQARELLDRAGALFAGDPAVTRSSLRLLAETGDWPAAEALAGKVLTTDPTSPDARRVFALSLAGQGRDRDALRAIYSALEVVRDATDQPQLRELRDQIERRLWVTSGCESSQLPDLAREGDSTARAEKFLALAGGCVGGNVGQRLSHFSVGYKRLDSAVVAESREARLVSVEVASRALMPLLEQHYSTLTSTLAHQVGHPIPVVFLEDLEYRFSAGAPAWAGGQYDHEDKTITIPIGIADRIQFKDPEAEQEWGALTEFLASMVLIHEVAHAFIDDASMGVAPRELHEGLAQFLEREVTHDRTDLAIKIEEGARKRAKLSLGPGASEADVQKQTARLLTVVVEELRTADIKHAGTLVSTYTGGELFVEYLVKQRSMAGIQALLQAMRETRSVDESFSRVYGQSMDGARRNWLDRLRQQWGAGAPRRE